MMGERKRLVDDRLVFGIGFRQSALTHIDLVQPLWHEVGQRHQHGRSRLLHALDVEQRHLGDAAFHCCDAVEARDFRYERLGRPCHIGEDVGEGVALIVLGPSARQRVIGPDPDDQCGDTGRDHQRNGQRLGPQPGQIAQQFDVERAHRYQLTSDGALRVALTCSEITAPSAKLTTRWAI